MLDRTGRPNHLNMRRNLQMEFLTELNEMRRQQFNAEWRPEWEADGTIPVGAQFIAYDDKGRPLTQPTDFGAAMVAIWPAYQDEPKEGYHIDPVRVIN